MRLQIFTEEILSLHIFIEEILRSHIFIEEILRPHIFIEEISRPHIFIPEAGSNYICCSVTLIDFVFKKNENYYLQVFLKECKYIEKEKKGDNIH